ncbi:MAG: TlpA disulfide reductase family protein [Bryobacteraceae bacterium]
MDKHDETNVDNWVDDRLAALSPDSNWQPNETRARAQLRELAGRPGNASGRRKWTWAAASTIAAGLCVLAFPAPRAVAQRLWVPCVEACQGLWLGVVDVVRVAAPAPDFTARSSSGLEVRLSDYKGKVVLLNFWASWCPPCRTEMPWFSEFQQTYGSQGLAVIGVSLADVWPVPAVSMDTSKILYPLVVGHEDLAKRYGVTSLPATLLIDRQGRIVAQHVGIVSRKDYEKEIVQLLAK